MSEQPPVPERWSWIASRDNNFQIIVLDAQPGYVARTVATKLSLDDAKKICDSQAKITALEAERKPIWCASIDEVPSLTIVGHEVCDPGPLTSEEVVKMWDTLKEKYVGLQSQVEQLTQALRRYARHKETCRFENYLGKCNCGLDALLNPDAALQPQVKEKI